MNDNKNSIVINYSSIDNNLSKITNIRNLINLSNETEIKLFNKNTNKFKSHKKIKEENTLTLSNLTKLNIDDNNNDISLINNIKKMDQNKYIECYSN